MHCCNTAYTRCRLSSATIRQSCSPFASHRCFPIPPAKYSVGFPRHLSFGIQRESVAIYEVYGVASVVQGQSHPLLGVAQLNRRLFLYCRPFSDNRIGFGRRGRIIMKRFRKMQEICIFWGEICENIRNIGEI